jgi:xanthine dehydrogenase accessory factor
MKGYPFEVVMNIFSEAARLEEQNRPFALAQIVDSRGSTPRHSAQMLILDDGSILGTIGGGMVERRVIDEALEAINEKASRMFHGRMVRNGNDAVGSDCGGAMSVYISVHGLRPRLVLIGAGHVNRAVAQSAALLGFEISVADIYPESLNPAFFPPLTQLLHADTFSAAVEKLAIRPDNFVLIATNNKDREALDRLIALPGAWLGLLASQRKVQVFLRQLRENGVAEEKIARLHAPVGYNIGAETPNEIAISVLAEILQFKNKAPGGLMMSTEIPSRPLRVAIRGAGDIATGVALRLWHAGFKVIMLEVEKPTVIRRTVAFAQAVFDGEMTVEGVKAKRVSTAQEALRLADNGAIPVLVDPLCESLQELQPGCVVDAILAKENLGTHRELAPAVIALGPGFNAGQDCHAVIETNRGHWLGKVIYEGRSQENTGVPGNIMGHTSRRVIRSPGAGVMCSRVQLGDIVSEGEVIATVGDVEILAPLSGMVRGLLNDGLVVDTGFKISDIDPRGEKADYTSVSDKARAIGGGVLEALMTLMNQNVKKNKTLLTMA